MLIIDVTNFRNVLSLFKKLNMTKFMSNRLESFNVNGFVTLIAKVHVVSLFRGGGCV